MLYRGYRPASPFQSTAWDDQIDYTNSLTAGLIFCTFPSRVGIMRNAIGGQIAVAGTVAGAELPGNGISRFGPAFIGRTLTHPDADFTNPAATYASTINRYSLMVTAFGGASGSVQNLMDADNKSTERVFQFRINATFGAPEFIAFDTGGSANVSTSTIGAIGGVEQLWTQIGVAGAADDVLRITAGFAGQKPETGGASIAGKTMRALSVASKITLFNVLGSTEQVFLGDIYLACIWARPLTIEEQFQLVVNPFAFLKPSIQRAAMTASAGGARQRAVMFQ